MMKKIKRFIYVILVCFLWLIPVDTRGAEKTLGDLKRTYQNLLAEKQAYDNKSNAAKNEIKEKEAAIKQANADIQTAQNEFDAAQVQIEESNQNIAALKLESEKVLQYMQQVQSQNAYVEYVTGASSMTDLVTRIEAVKQVSGYITDTINNLEIEIKKNEELKKELEAKQATLASNIDAYNAKIAQLNLNIEEYDEFSLDINAKLNNAKVEYETNKRICQTNIGKSDDSVVVSSCYNVPVSGEWMRPLNKGTVTSTWGYRTHPVTGQAYSFHNAIDIGGNAEGTPIYAAAAGKVVAKVSKYSCGGNMLYIDVTVGGQQYTTYYYHLLRFNVNVGDVVNQNTIIGYVGGYSTSTSHGGYDSCTTGAHLHYGVQKGWYDSSKGIVRSNIITPPLFKNAYGYRFSSRY